MALDLSLARTGYALPDGSAGVLVPPKGSDRGMARLAWIRDEAYRRVCVFAGHLVVIEGYAMGMGRDAQNHAMGELGGVVRLKLYERGIPYVEVAPGSLKKYATGKGNAGKELVLVEAVKRLDYAGSDNNEADALWLRMMALDHYAPGDSYVVRMPAANREALTKIVWPVLTGL